MRVIQGRRAGESGVIGQLIKGTDGLDSHAVLTLGMGEDGSSKTSLTIMINNLRIKKEVDPNTQGLSSEDLFMKNVNRVVYSAGELILFDNYRKVGLVLEVNPESLRVLDEANRFVHVRTQEVSRKVIVNTRSANCIDCENNVISRMTYVKVKDR